MKEVNYTLPTSMQTPDQKVDNADSQLPSTTNPSGAYIQMYICSIPGSGSYLVYDLDKGSLSFSDLSFLICKMGTTLMAESEEELKRLWMKMKEENEKVGLKLNLQKTKIMASGLISSWKIDRKTMETVRNFILGAPKSLQMVTSAMKLT